jgi:hypothetical protein
LKQLDVVAHDRDLWQTFADPPVEVGETLVPRGEESGGDQETAQVVGCWPVSKVIQALVGERDRAGAEPM